MSHTDLQRLRLDISKLAGSILDLTDRVTTLAGTVATVQKEVTDIRRFNNSRIAETLIKNTGPWFNRHTQ